MILDSLAIRPVPHLIHLQFPVPDVDPRELADQRPQDQVEVLADDTGDAVAKLGLLQRLPVQDDVDSPLGGLKAGLFNSHDRVELARLGLFQFLLNCDTVAVYSAS